MFGSFGQLPSKAESPPPAEDVEDDYSDDGFEEAQDEVEGKGNTREPIDLDIDFGFDISTKPNPNMSTKQKSRAVKGEALMKKRRRMMQAYSSSASPGQGKSAKIVSGKMMEKNKKAKDDVLKKGKRFLAQSKKRRKEEKKLEDDAKKREMEKLRATMERIEKSRWDEIREREERTRRQEERRKVRRKDGNSKPQPMGLGGLGGYAGARVKPAWVGVLDTPTIVVEEDEKEAAAKKIEDREKRIKQKTQRKNEGSDQAEESSIEEETVEVNSDERELDQSEEDYESSSYDMPGADVLIAASPTTPQTPTLTPTTRARTAFAETPDTAMRTRQLREKVEEVELLVGRMRDVASRVEKRLEETHHVKKERVVPRALPRLMTDSETEATYRPQPSPTRASPTQLKLANKVIDKLMDDDKEDEDYEDEVFEDEDDRKARSIAEVGYTMQMGGTPKRERSSHVAKIASQLAESDDEESVPVPDVAKDLGRWGMVNSPGRVRMSPRNKSKTKAVEAVLKIEEVEDDDEWMEEDDYDHGAAGWDKEDWTAGTDGNAVWTEQDANFGVGAYSVVDMFAAEIFRQKVDEEKKKMYQEADKMAGMEQEEENVAEWSDDEREMLMLQNTKDVVRGREPRVKVSQMNEKEEPKKDPKQEPKAVPVVATVPKENSNEQAEPRNTEGEAELEGGDGDEEQNVDNNEASADYSAYSEDYHDAEADMSNGSGEEDEEDSTETSASSNSATETSASTSYETTVSSPVRLSPSELQAKLLGELAVHDMLTEQLMQLNEVEKTYTVSVAEAELVKVKGDWGKERERLEMVEEMRAQQVAYENTLRIAVERAREIERMEESTEADEESYEDSSFESYQGTPRGIKGKKGRSSPKVHPTPSPATPATSEKSKLERSASAYSEDFDVSDEFDASEENEGSMFSDAGDVSAAGTTSGGGWKKERDEVVRRRKEIEEQMWKVRERAVREVFKTTESEIKKNEEWGEDRKRDEIKRAKRRRREGLAELNRERWQVRAMRIREEEVFERLRKGLGGRGDEEDWIWRERFGAESLMGAKLDDSIEEGSSSARLPLGRGYNTGSGVSEGDDESVVEMRSRLRLLKKRKEEAEKILRKKRSETEKKKLEEEIRKLEGIKRRSSDVSTASVARTEEDYYEESFESEDEKSIRSRRSTGSIRSKGFAKEGRLSRGDSIEMEMDVEEDESSSSFDSVEEEVEKVGKGEAEEASEIDEYSEEVSRDVSKDGSSRRASYARGGRSMASEVSEPTGYGGESFESYVDDRSGVGAEGKKTGGSMSGRGIGLVVEVQRGGREVEGTLTNTLTNQSRGGDGSGKRRKPRKKESFGVGDMSRDKENESFGVNGGGDYSDEDFNSSFDSIKGRIKELQRKVDKKNKEKRKEEERRRLIDLERRLLMELEGGDAGGIEEEVQGERSGRRSISPGPSLSASALSSALGTSGFGKDISVVKGEQLIDTSVQVSLQGMAVGASRDHGEGTGEGATIDVASFLRDEPDPATEEVESAVMSDSFQSRSSGEGSTDDDEKAVRRTEKREREDSAATMMQTRLRGWKAREYANHRRAVIERMVRKARAEERELSEKERYGLDEVSGEVGEEGDVAKSRFDELLGSESSDGSYDLGEDKKPISTEEEVEKMVKMALLAADIVAREIGEEEGIGQGSPAPGLNESYVSGSSTDSEELAARVQEALVEDSFASGFGESADLEGLLSSMAEEHAENQKTAMAAAEQAVDAIGLAAADIIVGLVIEKVWEDAVRDGGKEMGEKLTNAAVVVQRVGRGKIGRTRVKEEREGREQKRKTEAAVFVQKVGRGKLGRVEGGKRREKKKRFDAAITVQAAERARIGRIVGRQKREKKEREDKIEVKRKIKENAEREANEARERIRKKAEDEKMAKLQEDLRRKERVGELVVKELLEKMLQEEMGEMGRAERRTEVEDVAGRSEEVAEIDEVEDVVEVEETEEGKGEEGGDDWGGPTSLSGAPRLLGQHSVPMEGQEEEEDDDMYDFGGGSAEGVPIAQRQEEKVLAEFDWKLMEKEFLEEVVEGVDWDKLSDHKWRIWSYEEAARTGEKGDPKKRKKERKAIKKEKWSHIKGGVDDIMEDSFDPDLSGSMSDGGEDEALPLGYFLRMEKEKADNNQERQMRRKAVFDCVNEVVGRKWEEVYGSEKKKEGVVVVGGIEGWVRGPEARRKRGKLVGGWVTKEVMGFITPKHARPGNWDDGTTLSSRGVYEKGEGDEEWGGEAERREQEVVEEVERWLWGEEMRAAVDDMMTVGDRKR